MDKIALQKLVRKTLRSQRYVFGTNIKDQSKIYVDTWIGELTDGITVYVVNSHNDYRPEQLSMYKSVAKALIDDGYQISMCYPCHIRVTNKI